MTYILSYLFFANVFIPLNISFFIAKFNTIYTLYTKTDYRSISHIIIVKDSHIWVMVMPNRIWLLVIRFCERGINNVKSELFMPEQLHSHPNYEEPGFPVPIFDAKVTMKNPVLSISPAKCKKFLLN